MRIDKLDLIKKGWTTKEINQASTILAKLENDKSKVRFTDYALYVVMYSIMILNSFVCAIILTPFIFSLPSRFIMVIIGLTGLVFGVFFSLIIGDIEKVHKNQRTNMFVLLLVNAITNFYLIVSMSKEFSKQTGMTPAFNLYILAGAYFVAFMMPHIVYMIRHKNNY